jgi:hypothetical protein
MAIASHLRIADFQLQVSADYYYHCLRAHSEVSDRHVVQVLPPHYYWANW